MLDGASRIRDLVSFAKDQDMPGIALTDHGVMYGSVKFYQEAKKAGIKPIMGCEVYVTAARHDRSRAKYYHLTLLARTPEGYKNLMKLSTVGFLEGFYYKPRVDIEMLKKHGKGIICLSGCLSAEVPSRILEGRLDEARKLLLEYTEIFDAVFLEMQDHIEIPEQKRVNEGLLKLHKDTGIPLVATNDSHYTTRADARMHDFLLCIGTGKFYNDPNRMKFVGEEFYVKPVEEMERLFPNNPEALEITDLDPLQYSLLFERFLNPDRISMPDVDIDFSVQGRGEVMRYVTEKYGGHEHVAQIITFGTLGAKAAIRDAGRVFQYPYDATDKLAKFIPEKPVGTTLRDVLKQENGAYTPGEKHPGAAREMLQYKEQNAEAKKTLDTALKIEGFPRHAGTHAAGVVISEEPLTDIVPLQCVTEDENSVMVQHPMGDVEALGLLKVDFLGLRNLDVIEETLKIVREATGEEIDIRNIPLDDEKTLRLFARGDTFGVFQFESSGMQRMLQEVRPDRFDDLVALNALYRPG